jgi:hypothetical protein
MPFSLNAKSPPRYPTTINFTCATKKVYQTIPNKSVIQEKVKEFRNDIILWGNIAVQVELGTEGPKVFFVPIICGAVCNCDWLIVDSTGSTSLGFINGCVIEVEVSESKWPRLLAYGHMGAGDGVLTVYECQNNQYSSTCKITLVGASSAPWQKCKDNPSCCP